MKGDGDTERNERQNEMERDSEALKLAQRVPGRTEAGQWNTYSLLGDYALASKLPSALPSLVSFQMCS